MRPKKIYVTIYGVTKTIRQWATEYDLPYRTIYDRMERGDTGEELIRPERHDMLTPKAVRRLWHGRWTYRAGEPDYRRPWVFRRIPRTLWVYVGA